MMIQSPEVIEENETIQEESSLPSQEEPTYTQELHLKNIIENYLDEQGISKDGLSIYISSFDGQERYTLNEDIDFFGASLYKVPLAMIYYEYINQGLYHYEDTFLYESYHFEAGGPISEDYEPGTYFTLADLLHYMIVDSDNTAGHILFENLGGWIAFKELGSVYGIVENTDTYYSYDNVFTASYLHDCLNYLYQHQDSFSLLIEDMENTFDHDFLNRYIDVPVAQKYGYYDPALNVMGFVEATSPYSIVILSEYGYDFVEHIGRINELCYKYFNK